MKNTIYDRSRAMRLVPLLRSIAAEIGERSERLTLLEQCRRSGSHVDAEIAEIRRSLRHTAEELARLGCTVDELPPLVIRIPGDGGGWTWRPGADELEELTLDRAARISAER